MKRCPNCNRAYSDMVTICPACHIDISSNAMAGSNPVGNNLIQQSSLPVQKTPPIQQAPSAPIQTAPSAGQNSVSQGTNGTNDRGSIMWGLPGLLFPIVGVIIWACLRMKKPASAKIALNGAAIGVVLGVLMRVFL